MSRPLRIAALSDITIGYAVPQIQSMVAALCAHYAPAEGFILEPDMKGRRELATISGIAITRLLTRMPPHDHAFHVEYNIQLHRALDRIAPDVVVFLNASVVPALLLSRHKPAFVIYYMLESLSHQLTAGGQDYLDLNQMVRDQVDVVVVPEYRRAELDLERLNWPAKPVVEMLNVAAFDPPASDPPPCDPPRCDRPTECAFLHAGTIGADTYCTELADDGLGEVRIDFAGPIDSEESRAIVARLASYPGTRQYLGLLPASRLHEIMPRYAYRLVLWRPADYHTLYASPNKMFESIAAGIPPVCTPHPQCVEILREFDCGLLLDDWSREALFRAIGTAQEIFGRPRYAELVANCRKAFENALNWGDQFAALRPLLPPLEELRPNDQQSR